MGILIEAESLLSKGIAKLSNNNAIRTVGASFINQETQKGSGGTNIFSSILGFLGGVVSKVWSVLKPAIEWTFSGIWGLLVSAFQFVWNFNWNTDITQAQQQLESAKLVLANGLGQLSGIAAGYLLCGALPGAAIFLFNEELGSSVLQKLGEEAFKKLNNNLQGILSNVFAVSANAAFTYLYADVRALWRDSDDTVRQQLQKKGIKATDIDKAIQTRNQPWSFSKSFQEWENSIKNPLTKAFVQQFVQSFSSSCIEAGYCVAHSLDAHAAQQETLKALTPLIEIDVEPTTNLSTVTKIQ